ncbi:MAG: NFACT family protein [Nanoarchaeota archaeon]|nr:NFACT family protein [Nanoarchaeota archaeon]MBU1622992.1 NFACT family protein [Nanoarchaeota archaeon]MBU1974427.1 NFACT family protein [Nanoarchaeota archaeon]
MKKGLTSLELTAVMNELQFLVKGKISQIYHQEKKELILQLHAPGEGKQYLKIIPGKFLCLTSKKDAPLRPSGFCMQLRKYLSNAFIKNFYQKDAERIVVFELEKKEKYYLIIELYSKGNIILVDEEYNIIGLLERQIWKERIVQAKEKYVFPAVRVNWKELSEKELESILQKSEKKNLATSLATEAGLGGLYAEEVCKLAEVDKNCLPQEVDAKTPAVIIKSIKKIKKLIEEPAGFIYEEEITPFALLEKKEKKKTKTYNEAINTLNPFIVVSPYERRIGTLIGRVNQQEEAIKKQEERIELNTKKGELIYEKYTPLQKLLDIVKELRKGKEWSEVAEELKKEKKISKVDLKNKKVIISL